MSRRVIDGGVIRGGIFLRNFLHTNQKFPACGGPIFSLIVFTTAYLAQKCHEQPPGLKMTSRVQKLQFLLVLASHMHLFVDKRAYNQF